MSGACAPGLVADVVFATNVLDDASMFIRDPTQPGAGPDSCPADAMKAIRAKLCKKGKNVHLPVVNMAENVFCVRHDPSNTSNSDKGCCFSAEVSTPAMVIPGGTATTIHKRWSGWSALTARGAARQLITLLRCDHQTHKDSTQNNRKSFSQCGRLVGK